MALSKLVHRSVAALIAAFDVIAAASRPAHQCILRETDPRVRLRRNRHAFRASCLSPVSGLHAFRRLAPGQPFCALGDPGCDCEAQERQCCLMALPPGSWTTGE